MAKKPQEQSGRTPPGLVVLLALFILLASLYNLVTPLGEGPDEPGHMRYVLFLAREQRLPVQREQEQESDVPGEGHQPPLAYVLMLPAALWLPPEEQHITQTANPDFVWNGGTDPAAFIRSSQEYWPWQGVVVSWHLARAISTLLGAITVWCIWGAARVWYGGGQIALVAAALVALNPQFLFLSALVTNDTLLAALSAGMLWLCLAACREPNSRPTLRSPLVAGLLFGLALLTKQSALVLAPLLLWSGWQSNTTLRRATLHTLCWSAGAALVAGWWYLRNWQLYHDPFGLSLFQSTFATQPFDWRSATAWGSALQQLHASSWASFGWLSLSPPAWVIWVYTLLEVVALAGLLRQVPGTAETRTRLIPLVLLPVLALAWVCSFAFTAGQVAWQGRLLFPALPALALLLARGLVAWNGSRGRWRFALAGGVGTLLLVLATALPLVVIAPSYTWRTLPPPTTLEQEKMPLSARYAQEWERGVELRRWRLDKRSSDAVWAGQTITVTLTWHTLERIPSNWTIFVHLLDEQGTLVAKNNSGPQHGAFPMTLWTPGDWVDDEHPLTLPPDLAAGHYLLRVGLYKPWQRDPDQGSRQQVWAVDGTLIGDYADIGTMMVQEAPRSVQE